MKPKDLRTVDERADDFAKCLLWLICRNIKTKYNTFEDFKSAYCKIINGNASDDEQIKFCRAFELDAKLYRRILGQQKTGKYITLDQINPLLPKWLHYRPHFTRQYKSGKSYSVHSYWYIDFDHLKTIFGKQDELDATIDAKSAKYTKRQFMLINKLFLFDKGKANKAKRLEKERLERKAEKEKTMKKYKKIDGHTESEWNELHKSGKLAFTWEQACKAEWKKERRADKHRMTIAKKAAKATLKELTEAELKIKQLEAKVAYLEKLKDLNSDIPQEEMFVEKPLDRMYYDVNEVPWDDLPEDYIARDKWIKEHCSDGVKAQLKEDFERQRETIETASVEGHLGKTINEILRKPAF